MKVLIADDHDVVRRGLRQILTEDDPNVIVAEAANAQEALAHVRHEAWDVVILDISMPGRSGLDVLRDIRAHSTDLPVLVLSMHPEEQYALRVLKAGASGYLAKETAAEELLVALRRILSGGRYVSSAVAERLATELQRSPGGQCEKPHERLSDREYEVLRMLASGRTVSQIAAELSLSGKTVSTYRSRIVAKTSLRTNAELARYAIEHDLI